MINNTIYTKRSNYTLYLRFYKLVVAPRCFFLNGYTYFVHILDDANYVEIFTLCRYINNTAVLVVYRNCLKLYSNSKGLYFNFPYVNNILVGSRKIIRVYLCD